MSEYYLSIVISFDNKDNATEAEAQFNEYYQEFADDTGDILKAALTKKIGAEFSNYIFSPFYTEEDFNSLIEYFPEPASAKQYWMMQQSECKNKQHLWMDSYDDEIIGYAVLPDSVEILENGLDLEISYPCTIEQMQIKTAFLTEAFKKVFQEVKPAETDFFDEDSDEY